MQPTAAPSGMATNMDAHKSRTVIHVHQWSEQLFDDERPHLDSPELQEEVRTQANRPALPPLPRSCSAPSACTAGARSAHSSIVDGDKEIPTDECWREEQARRLAEIEEEVEREAAAQAVIRQYKSLPLQARAEQEGWHIARSDIEWVQRGKVRHGSVADVKPARWRGIPVAVKSAAVQSKRGQSANAKQIMHEITIAARCNRHPNLVLFLGCSLNDPRDPLLLYEFLSNGSLPDYFGKKSAEEGRLWKPSRDLFLKWARDLSLGLAFLHGNDPSVVHGNINPNNLYFHEEQQCLKIGDFCHSRFDVPGAEATSEVVCSHQSMDTLAYVDPELVQGSGCYKDGLATKQTDIFSAAMVCYYMRTGRCPSDLPHPRLEGNKFRRMESLLTSAWGPAERRPTAAEMAEAFKRIGSCRSILGLKLCSSHSNFRGSFNPKHLLARASTF